MEASFKYVIIMKKVVFQQCRPQRQVWLYGNSMFGGIALINSSECL